MILFVEISRIMGHHKKSKATFTQRPQSVLCVNGLSDMRGQKKNVYVTQQHTLYRSNNGCRCLWIDFYVIEQWEQTAYSQDHKKMEEAKRRKAHLIQIYCFWLLLVENYDTIRPFILQTTIWYTSNLVPHIETEPFFKMIILVKGLELGCWDHEKNQTWVIYGQK